MNDEGFIDVSNLCPAHLLQILYLHAKPSVLHSGGMSLADAVEIVNAKAPGLMTSGVWPEHIHFDYVWGRPIKIIIAKGKLWGAHLFDRDAPDGPGTCRQLIEHLRTRECARNTSEALEVWKRLKARLEKLN